ncbi:MULTISPECIES: TraR/DksA C4-type zinc finger protein [Snodgrassella]|nr:MULTISPECIES: TraR/DksA C4-type zinc finger protein [unclassified Snodgrassella]MCT6881472.1 TraR/DksA C4-type zinc finger protein [Snodgrassella alvi]MCX8749272.1 TraR/DksA C4-type zinc finger protein [Snodgrassella sp. B3088]
MLSSTANNDESTTEKNDNQQVNAVRLNNIRMCSNQFCLECNEPISPERQFQYPGTRFCSNCEEKIAVKRSFLSSYKRRFNRNRNQT